MSLCILPCMESAILREYTMTVSSAVNSNDLSRWDYFLLYYYFIILSRYFIKRYCHTILCWFDMIFVVVASQFEKRRGQAVSSFFELRQQQMESAILREYTMTVSSAVNSNGLSRWDFLFIIILNYLTTYCFTFFIIIILHFFNTYVSQNENLFISHI